MSWGRAGEGLSARGWDKLSEILLKEVEQKRG